MDMVSIFGRTRVFTKGILSMEFVMGMESGLIKIM